MSPAPAGGATPQDRPTFEIKTAGTPLDAAVAADVIEIEVHEEVGRHGRLTLLIQNWDADQRRVRHSDNGPFTPGTAVTVALGYHAVLTTVFDGVVASVTAHFPEGANPVLRVEGRSRSVILEYPPRSRQLTDVTDADVASAIAADYALGTDTQTGAQHAFWVSDRTSDWEALTRRAAELGWIVYVRGTMLVLRPPAPPADPIALAWTQSIIELQLTQDLTHAVDSAVGIAWDLASLTAAESDEGAAASGVDIGKRSVHDAALSAAGWPRRTARLESPSVAGSDEADLRAIGTQRVAALAHVHGRGVVIGDPKLRCDGWVTIAGAGDRLSGPHYVSAARHHLSARAYRTEFQVGMPPRLMPPTPAPPGAATTGGAIGAGTSAIACGVVEALDDPEAQNRVRVRLPWRTDGGDGVWARIANLDAGDGYGAVVVPSVGQEVLVGFVDGNPASAVVLGALYNGAQKPPMTVDPATNAVRALVSPDGHSVRLEDGAASAVTVVSGKGHSVVMDDANSAVVLTHKDSGNAIRLSAKGIEFTAAQGDITLTSPAGTISLDALKLEATSSGPSKIATSATFDLTAAGSLGLKGALITIN